MLFLDEQSDGTNMYFSWIHIFELGYSKLAKRKISRNL